MCFIMLSPKPHSPSLLISDVFACAIWFLRELRRYDRSERELEREICRYRLWKPNKLTFRSLWRFRYTFPTACTIAPFIIGIDTSAWELRGLYSAFEILMRSICINICFRISNAFGAGRAHRALNTSRVSSASSPSTRGRMTRVQVLQCSKRTRGVLIRSVEVLYKSHCYIYIYMCILVIIS